MAFNRDAARKRQNWGCTVKRWAIAVVSVIVAMVTGVLIRRKRDA